MNDVNVPHGVTALVDKKDTLVLALDSPEQINTRAPKAYEALFDVAAAAKMKHVYLGGFTRSWDAGALTLDRSVPHKGLMLRRGARKKTDFFVGRNVLLLFCISFTSIWRAYEDLVRGCEEAAHAVGIQLKFLFSNFKSAFGKGLVHLDKKGGAMIAGIYLCEQTEQQR